MSVTKRQRMMVAAGLAAVALISAMVWGIARRGAKPVPQTDTQGTVGALTTGVVSLSSAPADVQDAAARLMHSRVGYAIVKPDRTYLIISTGSDDLKVRVAGAQGQPAGSTPTFVDVNLASDGSGERLLIATTSLTTQAEYQFNLDGVAAGIPTLHNPDMLALVTLPNSGGFVALSPTADQMIGTSVVSVSGYARVFEAQFTVRVMTAKGRVIGEKHVMAAAGAPSWGSFKADVAIDTADLPETGFVVFEEGMTQAKLVVPVRFRAATQLG